MTAPLTRTRDTRNKGVTREAVATAAVTVLDSVGIHRLSMRLVALELGVSPMALYNHVDGKAELLELVATHLRAGIVVDDAPAPREQLHSLLAQLCALGARHPLLLENPLALIGSTAEALALPLRILRLLSALGLDAVEVRRAYNALSFVLTGSAAVSRAVRGDGVAALRERERALLAAADEADRDLVREMSALPRTSLEEQLRLAVDDVLDSALSRARG